MKEVFFMILLVIKDKKVELLVQQKMSSPLVVKRLYCPLHRTGQREMNLPIPSFPSSSPRTIPSPISSPPIKWPDRDGVDR